MTTKQHIHDLPPVYATAALVDGQLAFAADDGDTIWTSAANANGAQPGDRGELVRVKSEDGKNTVFRFVRHAQTALF